METSKNLDAITPDKVEEILERFGRVMRDYALGKVASNTVISKFRKALTQYHQDLMSEVVDERVKWETYQDHVESIFDWLQGEKGDFPDLSQKPHYTFRSQLRKMRGNLTPPKPRTLSSQ